MAAILIVVGTIPVALSRADQPAQVAVVTFQPMKLFRTAPVGIAGSFMIGVANGAFWSLGTLFATSRGLSTNGAALFMSIAVIGGAAMQWPVGRLSDSHDRRLVLAGVMVTAATVALLLAFLPLGGSALFAMALLFGMTSLTGYSVAAAHAYDRASKTSYVEMAAGVLLANVSVRNRPDHCLGAHRGLRGGDAVRLHGRDAAAAHRLHSHADAGAGALDGRREDRLRCRRDRPVGGPSHRPLPNGPFR